MAAVVVVVALLSPRAVSAESAENLAIGVPQLEKELNMLDLKTLPGMLLRAAISGTVLKNKARSGGSDHQNKQPSPGLGLADNLAVSADYRRWTVRIRGDAVFWNDHRVRGSDVCYSLKVCNERGELNGLSRCSVRTEGGSGGARRDWVDIEIDRSRPAEDIVRRLAGELAECPVVDERTAVLFGKELGMGTNLVGSGPFRVTDFDPGKSVHLERVRRRSGTAKLNQTIELRSFDDPRHALTALRLGTIDLMLTESEDMLRLAEKDETLRIERCARMPAIYRRGLNFSCDLPFDAAELKYVG